MVSGELMHALPTVHGSGFILGTLPSVGMDKCHRHVAITVSYKVVTLLSKSSVLCDDLMDASVMREWKLSCFAFIGFSH